MAEKLKTRLQGSSIFVIFYGLFVVASLVHQALIPFLVKYAAYTGTEDSRQIFLNMNFHLPMGTITDFWALISATFVGVDRAAFSVAAFKDHHEGGKVDFGHRGHLIQIILQSFLIYVVAVCLNTFLEADFSLTPLAVSLGSSILLYVAGNKVIMASDKLAKDREENEEEVEVRLEKLKNCVCDIPLNEHVAIARKDPKTKKYRIVAEV